uniref:Uncharacterized protein n=1 Tax=Arundo donax TaxID=35708 RepID=A0A0A9E0G8_ARUDO
MAIHSCYGVLGISYFIMLKKLHQMKFSTLHNKSILAFV